MSRESRVQGREKERGGFTLWETALVLAVLAVTLILAAPAMVGFGTQKPETSASGLLKLLHDARAHAIDANATVIVRLDPLTGKFRIDSTGLNGTGALASGTLDLSGSMTLETALPRLQYVFRPSGAAFADSVVVRAADGAVLVSVDAWSGVARTDAR